jgi:hypothetical protein
LCGLLNKILNKRRRQRRVWLDDTLRNTPTDIFDNHTFKNEMLN